MAYDIPVAALILDHAAAASALGLPPDFFDDERQPRDQGVKRLCTLTSAPITSFAVEDESIYHVGIRITEDFCITVDFGLIQQAAALKKKYPHPLVQNATLCVVSEFC